MQANSLLVWALSFWVWLSVCWSCGCAFCVVGLPGPVWAGLGLMCGLIILCSVCLCALDVIDLALACYIQGPEHYSWLVQSNILGSLLLISRIDSDTPPPDYWLCERG